MEFLRNFIKEGYLKAIGSMPEYKIILGATAYFDKGILTEDDLKEINEKLNPTEQVDEQVSEQVEETPVEEVQEETENITEE